MQPRLTECVVTLQVQSSRFGIFVHPCGFGHCAGSDHKVVVTAAGDGEHMSRSETQDNTPTHRNHALANAFPPTCGVVTFVKLEELRLQCVLGKVKVPETIHVHQERHRTNRRCEPKAVPYTGATPSTSNLWKYTCPIQPQRCRRIRLCAYCTAPQLWTTCSTRCRNPVGAHLVATVFGGSSEYMPVNNKINNEIEAMVDWTAQRKREEGLASFVT